MQTINNRYTFDPVKDLLGKGGFGRVFRAQDTLLDREVVLKFATKEGIDDRYSLVHEIRRVIDFSHPNLVRYYDAILMPTTNEFGQEVEYQIGVLEYVKGGNLRSYMDKQESTGTHFRQIVEGILTGLSYLHERHLIHRDIKPENVLLHFNGENIVPKLCDFGISKVAGGEATALSNVIGTFEYMSPEQLGTEESGKIGTNSDLWAIGVMLYELFVKEPPFGSRRTGTTDAKIIGRILSDLPPEKLSQIPEPYREVVRRCLIKNPAARVHDANELLAILDGRQRPAAEAVAAAPEAPPVLAAAAPIFSEPPAIPTPQARPVQKAPLKKPQQKQPPRGTQKRAAAGSQIPPKKRAHILLIILYVIGLLWAMGFFGLFVANFDQFMQYERDLLIVTMLWLPAFLFGLIGILKRKKGSKGSFFPAFTIGIVLLAILGLTYNNM